MPGFRGSIMLKIFKTMSLIIFIAVLSACGANGEIPIGSDDIEPAVMNQFDCIVAVLKAAAEAVEYTMTVQSQANSGADTIATYHVATETSCPTAGHINGVGDLTLDVDTGALTITASGDVSLYVSDGAYPQYNCNCGGAVMDGILTLTASDEYPDFTLTISGTVIVTTENDTGWVVLLDNDCEIELSYSNDTITGTICGREVSA